MLLALDLFSTICFGCAGASIALRNRLSYFGIVLSAFCASTGGGTIRDIALQSGTVFWLDNPDYLLAVLFAIVITLSQKRTHLISHSFCRVINSLATSVFVMVGVLAALDAGCNSYMVLLYGVMTGIGGGLVRQLIFERRSVLHNPVNILSAVTITLCCSVLMEWGSSIIVAIVCLVFIHCMLDGIHRIYVQKNGRTTSSLKIARNGS